MTKLVGAGVMLDTIEETEQFDRREVLARSRDLKLLGTGAAANTNTDAE
jgi:hypothetical protein